MTSSYFINLAQWLIDPPNRFYRYPLAKIIFKPLYYTSITPNQVSVFHVFVGLSAAFFLAQGTSIGLILSLLLYELRALLDCFDGVLARWKDMSSVYGRHIDEISDVISTIGLFIASGIYFSKTNPEQEFMSLIFGVAIVLFLLGNIYDFYRRKIGAALTQGRDQFIEDVLHSEKKLNNFSNFFERSGYKLDLWRCRILTPHTYKLIQSGNFNAENEVQSVLAYSILGSEPRP